MDDFINLYFDKTKNENDKIYKNNFLKDYQIFSGLSNITWDNIRNDISRLGIKYDSQRRAGKDSESKDNIQKNPENNDNRRGCLIGIKRNNIKIERAKEIIDKKDKEIKRDSEINVAFDDSSVTRTLDN